MHHFQFFFMLSLLCGCALPVIVIPATLHLPRPYKPLASTVSSDYELIMQSIPDFVPENTKISDVGQGFFGNSPRINQSRIYPLQDSFIRGAIDAWAQHQHFVIRPDDIWFTILMQLNFYLRGHSAEVRDQIGYKNQLDVDLFGWIDVGVITQNIVDFEIKKWLKANYSTYGFLQPNFTTSTFDDKTVANLIIMGLTNTTSLGHCAALCGGGMPSITLLGEERDWQQLLRKLDYMPEFGRQPADYSKNLRPILSRFVRTFAHPEDFEIRQFWDDMVSFKEQECYETGTIKGWVTGFLHWNQSGDLLLRSGSLIASEKGLKSLDEVVYPWRNIRDLPSAYPRLHFLHRQDPGCLTSVAELMAGMIGKKVGQGRPNDYAIALQKANLALPVTVTDNQHFTLQPFSRWFQYSDSRYKDPAMLLGENRTAYLERVCRNRPE
jgi:hypothetical protein